MRLFICCFTLACGITPTVVPQTPPPRLGVVIVVDQMRADFLQRFTGFYTEGFAALIEGGTVFTDAHQDHAVTETAVGHATIATGVFPKHHGIVGNTWYDRGALRMFYASEDSSVQIVGLEGAEGRSPAQLRSPTVGDWLKARSPASKVYAVALKDRAATFMAGKKADAALWYEEDAGRYVTSTYYTRDSLPWLEAFNRSGRIEAFLKDGWKQMLPVEGYFVSREDSFPQEANGIKTTFPHTFTGDTVITPAYYSELRVTPFADQLTLDLARDVITEERLGADADPDLIFIGLSAADYIGHTFGPLSQEAEDYYVRVDGFLGDFIAFLDEQVGREQYFVVLTSDHGVLPLPEELARRGLPARRISRNELQLTLQEVILGALEETGITTPPRVRLANGVSFEFTDPSVTDAQRLTVAQSVAARLREASFVEDAFTYAELQGTGADRSYLEVYRRQFPPDLSPDVALRFSPFTLAGWGDFGTTHGSPYVYDTKIPLVFWGGAIRGARVVRRVRSVDIAPTIAHLLAVTPPANLNGEVLKEVLVRP